MEREDRAGLVLTVGFGTAVAMWAAGYVGRLPGVQAPPPLLGLVFLALGVAGGIVAGRWGGGAKGGALAGVVTWLVNLLILGSLLGGDSPGAVRPSAPVFLGGALLAGLVLGAVGGWLGGRLGDGEPPAAWTHLLSLVAMGATFLLLVAGGVVTSARAGLAVVDWPNSFGYNMFLYPLSRMTGGIYFEHAHRLLGSLVGLTTLVTALYLTRRESRRWVKALGWAALALVVVQGVMGGLRVTGRFTLAQDPALTRPSLVLAAVHGVTGQLFFALLSALAVVTAPGFARRRVEGVRGAGLETVLGALLVVQLALGAIQRHFAQGLLVHISMAAVVAGVALAAGLRSSAAPGPAAVRRLGKALVAVVLLQILLGVGALVVVMSRPPAGEPLPWQTVLATAHQGTGAVLLALAVALAVWRWPSPPVERV